MDLHVNLQILTDFFQIASTLVGDIWAMEQHTFTNVNNCLNTNIYSYLETSGGQSSNPYFNVDYFFNARVNLTSVAA
jgi:hypothetical protein